MTQNELDEKLREIIETSMKQCFDKGIKIGLANGGKIEKVTISVTDIRDSAISQINQLFSERKDKFCKCKPDKMGQLPATPENLCGICGLKIRELTVKDKEVEE